jgi:hypothetical protein
MFNSWDGETFINPAGKNNCQGKQMHCTERREFLARQIHKSQREREIERDRDRERYRYIDI